MARFIALFFAAVLVTTEAAGASSTAYSPRHAIGHQHDGWMAPNANPRHSWLYVASSVENVVAIYDLEELGNPEIGSISQGISAPDGVAIDSQGAVYVANPPSGTVTIYPAGATTPSLTLSQGLQTPVSVAADTNGDVYVGNRGASPSIQVYAQGQSVPYLTITSALIQLPDELLFDSSRNLYFSDPNTGVSEIASGSQQPVSLGLQVGVAGGLALDPTSGNLFVSDFNRHDVFVFAPGNPNSIRKLRLNANSDFLGFGAVKRTNYLFVPTCDCGNVTVFKHNSRKPWAVLTTVHNPQAATLKPAGVP